MKTKKQPWKGKRTKGYGSAKQSERSRAGHIWEKTIRDQNGVLSMTGRACVFKVPTDRGYDGSPRAKTWVDYSGLIDPTGRAVAFEAKRLIRDTSFSFSAVTDYQRLVLTRVRTMGGIAFVFVCRENVDLETLNRGAAADASRARFGTRREYYVLPYDEIERIERTEGRKSFPFPKHHAKPSLPLIEVHGDDPRAVYRLRKDETWLDAWERIEPQQERI